MDYDRGHRQLIVWHKAMLLVEECYRLTSQFPRTERFGLCAQIRRAAVSVPSNIAEGHNRRTRQAYAHHVSIALGSQAELETQLELGARLGLVSRERLEPAQSAAAEVGRLLHGLVRALESRRNPKRSLPSPSP
jgi:four helix bundle protein